MLGLVLYWKGADGALRCVDLPTESNVFDLKKAICATGGPTSYRQRLLHGAQEITDDCMSISDTGISNESTLTVLTRRALRTVSCHQALGIAILPDGSMQTFGRDDGFPQPDLGGRKPVAVAAGATHFAAVLDDGELVLWGYGACHAPDLRSRRAIAVSAGGSLSVGGNHGHMSYTMVVLDGGEIVTWTHAGDHLLLRPPNLTAVSEVSAGPGHALALTHDGTVIGWGCSASNRLSIHDRNRGVGCVSAGGSCSLLVYYDGSVGIFGGGARRGPKTRQATPPEPLPKVASVAGGEDHAAALTDDGSVVAWGRDEEGQLQVPTFREPVVGVVAGGHCTLAVTATGQLYGWGELNGRDVTSYPEFPASVSVV